MMRRILPGLPWAAAALLLGACAPSMPPAVRTDPGATDGLDAPSRIEASRDQATPVRYQFIYVVHGDAGYTYYDKEGTRHRADLDALAQAESVARNSPEAEVFIFHQKPVPFLGFFHGSDGTLRQFRNGRPVRKLAYDRSRGDVGLEAEAALFRKYAASEAQDAPKNCPAEQASAPARVFLYFGHEIPVTGGVPYSRSRLDTAFTLASFAGGLEGFRTAGNGHDKPFSLIILSACHGGTPSATRTLAPYAPYLLASPGELHLSYLDTRALTRLPGLTSGDTGASAAAQGGTWGRMVAEESFAGLEEKTATEITLSLYDTEKASAYLEARKKAWQRFGPPGPAAYRDCAADPSFGPGGAAAGVTVYYRAPEFGADKSKTFGSGWECPEAQAPYLLGRAP